MGGQEKGETRSCDTTQVAPLRAQNANKSVDDLSYSESKWAFSLLQKQTDGVWESPGCRRVSSLKPVARSPAADCLFRTRSVGESSLFLCTRLFPTLSADCCMHTHIPQTNFHLSDPVRETLLLLELPQLPHDSTTPYSRTLLNG